MSAMAKRKKKNINAELALAFFVVPPLLLIGFGIWAVSKGVAKATDEFRTERDQRQAQIKTMFDQAVLKYAYGTPVGTAHGGKEDRVSGDGFIYEVLEDDVTRETGALLGVAAWRYPNTSGAISIRSPEDDAMPDWGSRMADLTTKLTSELRKKAPVEA